jgi:hypothetical protein
MYALLMYALLMYALLMYVLLMCVLCVTCGGLGNDWGDYLAKRTQHCTRRAFVHWSVAVAGGVFAACRERLGPQEQRLNTDFRGPADLQ